MLRTFIQTIICDCSRSNRMPQTDQITEIPPYVRAYFWLPWYLCKKILTLSAVLDHFFLEDWKLKNCGQNIQPPPQKKTELRIKWNDLYAIKNNSNKDWSIKIKICNGRCITQVCTEDIFSQKLLNSSASILLDKTQGSSIGWWRIKIFAHVELK